jgi:hypothetical protein
MTDQLPTYRLLLDVQVEATQAPDMAILGLRKFLKALGRNYGFRCRDAALVPWPKNGKPALPRAEEGSQAARDDLTSDPARGPAAGASPVPPSRILPEKGE